MSKYFKAKLLLLTISLLILSAVSASEDFFEESSYENLGNLEEDFNVEPVKNDELSFSENVYDNEASNQPEQKDTYDSEFVDNVNKEFEREPISSYQFDDSYNDKKPEEQNELNEQNLSPEIQNFANIYSCYLWSMIMLSKKDSKAQQIAKENEHVDSEEILKKINIVMFTHCQEHITMDKAEQLLSKIKDAKYDFSGIENLEDYSFDEFVEVGYDFDLSDEELKTHDVINDLKKQQEDAEKKHKETEKAKTNNDKQKKSSSSNKNQQNNENQKKYYNSKSETTILFMDLQNMKSPFWIIIIFGLVVGFLIWAIKKIDLLMAYKPTTDRKIKQEERRKKNNPKSK